MLDFVNIKGQKKIRLDKMQFMDCWDVETALQEAGLQLPDGMRLFDLFEGAENCSYEYLSFDYCEEFEADSDDGYYHTDEEIKKYQAYKTLQTLFTKHTDLMNPDGVYIYISW